MTEQKKRLPWRCKNQQQAKDKAAIYNSREWKDLRIAKLRSTNGLCEECLKQGIVTSARCVHHVVPIETARTKDEMKRLAIDCGLQGLRSLCYACHAKIHRELGSNTAKVVKARAEARQDRWADNLMSKFITNNNQRTMQENKRLGIFGTMNYEKLKDMTMDERKLAVTNRAKEVLSRKTKDGKWLQIPDDDHDPYDVTAEYTIMDCRYNKQGKILATFKAQRTDEDLTIELTSFESVTS